MDDGFKAEADIGSLLRDLLPNLRRTNSTDHFGIRKPRTSGLKAHYRDAVQFASVKSFVVINETDDIITV